MKKLSAFLLLGILLVLVSAIALPAVAQDDEMGPGEGGVVIEPNSSDDPVTFNPLIYSDGVSGDVIAWLYPSVFGINFATGLLEPGVPGSLATAWEYDETGTVLTVTLRQDAFWNDGTQITSADVVWSTEAIRDVAAQSPRADTWETLSDGSDAGGVVASIEAPDDFTVVYTLARFDCNALNDIFSLVVPSHIYAPLYDNDLGQMASDPRRIPDVTFGPFRDVEFVPGERVSIVADQTYPDTQLGYVSPQEWVYLNVPDTNVAVERFLAGEVTYMGIPGARQAEFRDNPDYQIYEYTGNGFAFYAFNHANPDNPQPGLDEDGNPIEQDPHPIFGDVRVRRAIAMAFDGDALVAGVLDGNGIRVGTHTIPTSWVYNPDLLYDYDPEGALALLEEAGWVDDDGDTSTPLVCQGCLYAEEGAPLSFRLEAGSGSETVARQGELFVSLLADIGVEVDFQAVDFNSVVVPNLLGQTFDMAGLSWSLGLPVDPDVSAFYTPSRDIPGAGFNFVSFYNEEMNDLLLEARQVEGCDVEQRAEIYGRVQQILFDELPYLYLYVGNTMFALQNNVVGFDPLPFSRLWNLDAWAVVESE